MRIAPSALRRRPGVLARIGAIALLAHATAALPQQAPPRDYYVGNPGVGIPVAPAASAAGQPPPEPFSPASPNVRMFGALYSVESCVYDPGRGVIVAPSRGVPQAVRANDAWLAFINHDGSVHTPRWVGIQNPGPERDGMTPPLVFNEPLGSALHRGVLYFADRDGGTADAARPGQTTPVVPVVRSFDLATGRPLKSIAVPGSTGLNDLAVAADGTLYGTNSGVADRPETWAVWKITPEGNASVFTQGAPLNIPNGIEVDASGNIVVVNIGTADVITYSPDGRVLRTEQAAQSGNDGLVIMPDGVKFVSSVRLGGISMMVPGKPATLIAQNIPTPASMCYDSGANQLVIPLNNNNGLAFVPLKDIYTPPRPPAVAAPEPPAPIAGLRTASGTLADGTAYRIDVPAQWNGAALFNLDYASPTAPYSDQNRLLLAKGYALAGVTRVVTGWRVPRAVDNLTEVKRRFEAQFGAIRHPIAFGGSMGGHTVFIGAHRKPSPWVAGVSNCAGPAGAVAQWNQKLDALFVARTLLAPSSDVPIVEVPADFETTALPAWKALLEKAQQTPEGRARIALAAILGGLPDWASMANPRPAATDTDARQAGYYEALAGGRLPAVAQLMSSRRQINTIYGGNISWNTGIDYAAALARLPEKALVEALYRRANLSLASDLQALARAPRITEQPAALQAIAEQQYFGDLSIPVISMQGIGDPISASDAMDAISRGARAAGKQRLLRTVFTETAGHCTFSPGEIAAVVETIRQRLESGRWPDTSPASLNALAKTLAPVAPARFIDYTPNPFLRFLTPREFTRRAKGANPAR